MESIKLMLNQLGCANCANKIEKSVNNLSTVQDATVNFTTMQLNITLKDVKQKEQVIKEVSEIVQEIEPHIRVQEQNLAKKLKKNIHFNGWNFVKSQQPLLIGIVLFVIAILSGGDFWLYILTYLLIGGNVLLTATRNMKRGDIFDENFLMTIATLGAIVLGEYPEAIAVMLFYEIGEMFQHYAVNRSRQSISDLLDIRVDSANVVTASGLKSKAIEDVQVGDVIVVKPGERIPLDGVIVLGSSELDTSALTGESLLRFATVGEEILAGCLNLLASIHIQVTSTASTSTVAKILDLVENASSKKATTERFITKFCRVYTPVVVLIAVLVATLPPLFWGANFSVWFYRALVFLVVSCPCALVVSIPLGFFAGIGGASRLGILVKGANYLELLNQVEVVVFDKTGTLTKGQFAVSEIQPMNIEKQQFIKLAAYAESMSNHPIAKSIVAAYDQAISYDELLNYEELAGKGISVNFQNQQILIGNRRLMEQYKIEIPEVRKVGTIIHMAVDGEYKGYMRIEDEIKETSREAIAELKACGIKKVVMLTGDSKPVAQKVASSLNVDEVHAQLLPHEKVERVEDLIATLSDGEKLAFIGDGINDAPVLARADIGVAMGGIGSDVAIEAADIVLMKDDPLALVVAIHKSRFTLNVLQQNIVFALGVKCLVMLFSIMGIANMWMAVFADVGVTLLTIINSIRVLKK